MKQGKFTLIIVACVLLFLYMPILVLVASSFNESRFGGTWTGFSLKWYQALLHDRAIWSALINSLLVALSTTLVSTLLGTTAALALYRFKTVLQKAHYGLIYIPLIIPDILMGASLLLLFVFLNVKLGLSTVFIAHTTFCVSYVTLVIRSRLEHFEYTIIEAARDLGANSWQVFRKILIPLLAPGICAGALLAFTLSIDDFVITFFVLGPGGTTLPVYIYSMIKFGSPPLINALSTVLIAVAFIVAWITMTFKEEK